MHSRRKETKKLEVDAYLMFVNFGTPTHYLGLKVRKFAKKLQLNIVTGQNRPNRLEKSTPSPIVTVVLNMRIWTSRHFNEVHREQGARTEILVVSTYFLHCKLYISILTAITNCTFILHCWPGCPPDAPHLTIPLLEHDAAGAVEEHLYTDV